MKTTILLAAALVAGCVGQIALPATEPDGAILLQADGGRPGCSGLGVLCGTDDECCSGLCNDQPNGCVCEPEGAGCVMPGDVYFAGQHADCCPGLVCNTSTSADPRAGVCTKPDAAVQP